MRPAPEPSTRTPQSPPVTLTRKLRINAHLWLFVIAPRVRVHLMVYTCWLLGGKKR